MAEVTLSVREPDDSVRIVQGVLMRDGVNLVSVRHEGETFARHYHRTTIIAMETTLSDLERTEALRAGDPCEFRYPARRQWLAGTVIRNGGSGYWEVRDETDYEANRGRITRSLYIEHVRAVGTDPWSFK